MTEAVPFTFAIPAGRMAPFAVVGHFWVRRPWKSTAQGCTSPWGMTMAAERVCWASRSLLEMPPPHQIRAIIWRGRISSLVYGVAAAAACRVMSRGGVTS